MRKNSGFTLIEIMVSLALFAVVAVVAIGAFLKIIDADRRSEAIESAVNDTNFALESMVRDLRVGSDYHCSTVASSLSAPSSIPTPSLAPCAMSTNSNQMLAFNSSVTASNGSGGTCNLVHAYALSSGVIEKAEQQSCNQAYGGGGYLFVPLTSSSSELTIQTFDIKVDPQTGLNTGQPKVFILISGAAGASPEDQTSFTVQTTASQRLME